MSSRLSAINKSPKALNLDRSWISSMSSRGSRNGTLPVFVKNHNGLGVVVYMD